MNKFVVYTAIFGGYDRLIESSGKYEGVDFVCFTDDTSLSSKFWEIRRIEPDSDATFLNREIKMFPNRYLSEYDFSIYVDGNIRINSSPLRLFDRYVRSCKIAVPSHYRRDCVYKEAQECIRNNKGNVHKIRELMDEYMAQGFPEEFGLFEMNVIFRKTNDKDVIRLMGDWWHEFSKGSKRDQVSFPYVLWKNRHIKPCVLKESPRYSESYFSIIMHVDEMSLPFPKRAMLYLRLREHVFLYRMLIKFIELFKL